MRGTTLLLAAALSVVGCEDKPEAPAPPPDATAPIENKVDRLRDKVEKFGGQVDEAIEQRRPDASADQ